MAHFLNAAFGSGTASYCRLGNDLEEYSPELSANVEKKNNILGQTSVTIDSYQKQGEVAPYYAEKNDPLFEKLQEIIDGDLVLDDLKTDIVEGKLWGETADPTYPAVREECYIEVVSYGGDTTGYQIPFNVHYTGVKVKGKFEANDRGNQIMAFEVPQTSAPSEPEEQEPEFPAYQLEGLETLTEAGVINSPEFWRQKFSEQVTGGEVFGILGKLFTKATE